MAKKACPGYANFRGYAMIMIVAVGTVAAFDLVLRCHTRRSTAPIDWSDYTHIYPSEHIEYPVLEKIDKDPEDTAEWT